MIELPCEVQEQLADAVRGAAGRVDVRAAVEGIYGKLQWEIDERKPLCEASGRCCHFEAYGHRLYVTTVELAVFWDGYRLDEDRGTEVRPPNPRPKGFPVLDPGGCPFQVDRLCSVHSIRPFGCRIFFCDATAQEWQNQRYELFHAELKQAHERLGVPYFYVEWRAALSAVGLSPQRALSRT
jgi:Fe-S-cluster containining protein